MSLVSHIGISGQFGIVAARLRLRQSYIWLAAVAGVLASLAVTNEAVRMALLAFSAGLFFVICGLWVQAGWQRLITLREAGQFARMHGADETPCFVSNEKGRLTFINPAAYKRLGGTTDSVSAALRDYFASPAAVMLRLKSRAKRNGYAKDEVATRRGFIRLSVHRLGNTGYLWRLEEFEDIYSGMRGTDGIGLPMCVANKAGVVLFAHDALRRLLGLRPRRLDQVIAAGRMRSGEEVIVAGAQGELRAILAEVEGAGQRREIYLLPAAHATAATAMPADFESVPVALLRFRPDGRLIVANRAARDILNLSLGDAIQLQDIYEGLGRALSDLIDDIIAERVPFASEVLRARKLSHDSFHQVSLRRIVENGQAGLLAVVQDATAMKQLEAQFVQSQKMQAVGQLVGGIAHDFNNLLTAISGYCDLLLLRRSPEDRDFADLTQIEQNANRAAALVRQLLAFSRKQTLHPERLDLQDVLSEMMHLLSRLVGERVQLEITHAPHLGPIRADKRQLEQVVMNLVVNARDAMPDGGVIRVETDLVEFHEDYHRDRARVPAGRYAMIRVSDQGVGIPEDCIERIFEPFFTTKRVGEGTGLGLSTVYGIVKQSGGFVFVDSEVGTGSVFQLYFPIHDQPVELAAVAPSKPVLHQGEGVVLLVEDEKPVRAFASRGMKLRGYQVIEAESAERALEILADPGLHIDVFVTDLVMPGMDGPSWVRIALQQRPDVRVIFISGYAEDCLSDAQGRIANAVFLPKPFSLQQLSLTLQEQLA